MQDLATKRAQWIELHKSWVIANQAARKARLSIMSKFAACAAGNGPAPTPAELIEVEALEREVDNAKLVEDALIESLFKS